MQKRLRLVLILGICLATAFLVLRQWALNNWRKEHSLEWALVKDSETGISIRFPKIPTMTTRSREMNDVTIVERSYIYEPSLNTAYGLTTVQFPIPFEHAEREKMFTASEEGFTKIGKVLNSRNFSYKGHPGKKFDLEILGGNARCRVRVVNAGQNVAILTMVVPNEWLNRHDDPELKRLVNSAMVDFFSTLEFATE